MFNSNSKRRSACVAAGVMFAATVALGAISGTASAEERRGDWGRRHEWHHGWSGGYYHAPPVVYGSPYYAPPPVVYGPGFGLNINIR
jgi:hypothetical protein